MGEQFCTSCGAPRAGTESFCTQCGQRFEAAEQPPAPAAGTPPAQPTGAPAAQSPGAPSAQPPGAYPSPAPAQHQQVPPQRPRRRGRAWALGCLGVLFACAAACGLLSLLGGDGVQTASLSSDQRRVAEEFGLPETFSVVHGEDVESAGTGEAPSTHRVEAWDYHTMGVRVLFRDGAVVGTRDIAVLDRAAFAYPAVSPVSFAEGMSASDVTAMLGHPPGGEATLDAGLDEDVRTMVWSGVVSCTFADGGLVAAETAPIQVTEVAE
ncbi:hypothetical protein [Anaerosoma tenue]|uniref:hypothetical protein n=1 Tax=Anaerosoma tenue TaxID=2933588 RepID=UPI0022608618|nr:hypothetical protein [Anaerosoma tenue]MCK8114834.1 hypothetical protein [Anaerosoma tenue]